MPLISSGWHIGMSSLVFFAPIIAPTTAVCRTGPFLPVLFLIASKASRDIFMMPLATAMRVVMPLSLTSTILGRLFSSM